LRSLEAALEIVDQVHGRILDSRQLVEEALASLHRDDGVVLDGRGQPADKVLRARKLAQEAIASLHCADGVVLDGRGQPADKVLRPEQ
jgi:hypothetical protein